MIETVAYDYVHALVQAAANGAQLFSADVHKNPYYAIEKVKTIQIAPVPKSKLAPSPGGTDMEEFDVRLTLILLAKVADIKDGAAFDDALQQVFGMGQEIALDISNHNDLGGRVRDCLVQFDFPRTFTKVNNHPHALANLVLHINQTNELLEG